MTLPDVTIIKNLLVRLSGSAVYHGWGFQAAGDYFIWAEEGEGDSVTAGNRKEEMALSLTIDLFSQDEYCPLVEKLQNALNECERATWEILSVQHEEDGWHHWEWGVEVE